MRMSVCDISRTIQRNVSNYFLLVAVSLVLTHTMKEWQDEIQSLRFFLPDDSGEEPFSLKTVSKAPQTADGLDPVGVTLSGHLLSQW